MTKAAIETVLAWHAALNQADVERVLALTTADVEVGGPRGAGRGVDLLREWVERAAIRLEPRRVFHRDEVVVVAQAARWPAANGQLADPQDVVSVFHIEDERISSIVRYPDLAAALQASGLAESDEEVDASGAL